MQQINLYQAQLRKQKPLISFQHSATGIVALSFLLILFQSYKQYELASLEIQLKDTMLQLSEKNGRLNTFKNSLPKVKKDLNLKSNLVLLEKKLISKKRVLDVLSGQKLGNTTGFSNQFKGLARQTINGLWLTKLHFLEGGSILDFQGKVQNPALVPQYLKALSSEQIFKGTEFHSFIIQKNASQTSLDFKFNNLIKISSNDNIELSRR